MPDEILAGHLQFTLDPGHPHPIIEQLGCWTSGLWPAQMQDMYALGFANVFYQRYHRLWALTLADLQTRSAQMNFELWRADIPPALLARLQQHGLDTLAALFLLCRYPELERLLAWPHLFRIITETWAGLYLRSFGLIAADDYIQRVLGCPLREIFWMEEEPAVRLNQSRRYGRLLLAFLAHFPGRYHCRSGLLDFTSLLRIAPLLPHFLNSRARFVERLRLLDAFNKACGRTDIPADVVSPLFQRCLKQRKKARADQLASLLTRLQQVSLHLGLPAIDGLLGAAPSLRYLAGVTRRRERRLKLILDNRQWATLPPRAAEFPAVPLPAWACIEPIRDMLRLNCEGSYMHNCIASYAPELKAGTHAAFALAWPQRCTVLLVQEGGQWRLEEVRTVDNGLADADTFATLQRWLQGEPLAAADKLDDMRIDFFARLPRDAGLAAAPYWHRLQQCLDEDLSEEDIFEGGLEEDLMQVSGEPGAMLPFSGSFQSAPLCQLHLPDRLGPWRRCGSLAELERLGPDLAPFSTVLADASAADDAVMLYFHPACPHFYARVPFCADPESAVYFLRLPGSDRRYGQLDMQRMQDLRERLAVLTWGETSV